MDSMSDTRNAGSMIDQSPGNTLGLFLLKATGGLIRLIKVVANGRFRLRHGGCQLGPAHPHRLREGHDRDLGFVRFGWPDCDTWTALKR